MRTPKRWLTLPAAVLCVQAYAVPVRPPANPEVTRQVYLMGTRCTLTSYAPGRERALRELDLLIRVLEETERELSTWLPESALSRINHSPVGVPVPLTPPVYRLLEQLLQWSRSTERAFDPAIGALARVWGLREAGRRPSAESLKEAVKNSGMEHLAFRPDSISVVRERETLIDCGAFGKGEALDRLRAASHREGFSPWIVDLGGQVLVFGPPPESPGWPVRIAHPRLRERSTLEIRLSEGSLATSGGSERDLDVGGSLVGHILDPRTGTPARFAGSVTVWHSSALVADILSTALYVMGPEVGRQWAESREIAACFLIPSATAETHELEIRTTRAFSRRFAGSAKKTTGPRTSTRPPAFSGALRGEGDAGSAHPR